MGLRSQVSGSCHIDIAEHIDRKVRRFMGDAAAYAYIAMQQSIDDSGLDEADVSNDSHRADRGVGRCIER